MGAPTGLTSVPTYSGYYTPDQAAMINQVGYAMRPDAVMPTGQQWQQPYGYSGLRPDQIQAVNQQGFYNQSPVPSTGPSFFDQLMKAGSAINQNGLSSKLFQAGAPTAMPGGGSALGALGGALNPGAAGIPGQPRPAQLANALPAGSAPAGSDPLSGMSNDDLLRLIRQRFGIA